ncbi:MAG: flavodoxin/ferredoxin-dependent (E)-4-hydroxy-3-methylbut-2-enyl-diphosphate synthase [Arenicellales bacterium]|nr:flavodoxin/ferredoxin-dependent (E)-4-hydroxy-3-methylbut-2-enyl-diphosphate synthase [Arenicellales bacterium]
MSSTEPHPFPGSKVTRPIRIGDLSIGGGNPIVIQSMCATHTWDVETTSRQVNQLASAGAGIIRIAADSNKDAEGLAEIRANTEANLSVDLQENYRLAKAVAPFVDKIRYNPGHLYHHERNRSWKEKVRFLVDIAVEHDCALRVGVNAGSVDPEIRDQFPAKECVSPMVESAGLHSDFLESIGFTRFCVSLKDSDPANVIAANRSFHSRHPEVPLHLGVTEAGIPPGGIIKTRIAFEALITEGIGDTLRVSLTLPNERKHEEVEAGEQMLRDISCGRLLRDTDQPLDKLNIISCPSCSRVENGAFVELAEEVRSLTRYARDEEITIAVMGCRVNGPGETDDADLGLWCGPRHVNLKRGGEKLGTYGYDEILSRLRKELDKLISN